jgi:hypothetical protein
MDNKTYGVELDLKVNKFKAKMQSALKSLDDVQKKYKSAANNFKQGFSINTDEAENKIRTLEDKMKQLQNELSSGKWKNSNIEDGLKDSISKMEQEIQEIKEALNNINLTPSGQAGAGAQSMFEKLKSGVSAFVSGAKDGLLQLGKIVGGAVLSGFKKLGNVIANLGKGAVNLAVKGFKKLGSAIVSAGKNLLGFNKNNNKMSGGIGQGIANLKKFALSLFGIQTAYRAVSKAASAYLSMDSQLSNSIQSTWAGLGSFLAPVLEYLVGLFQKFLAYANAVMKALTGINFVARANAKAMSNSASSANSANKALAGFDELNNINQDTSSSSGGDSGTISLPDVDTSKVEEFANKLKEMFQNGDYYGIGEIIGQKITDALAQIPWASIQEQAKNIATGIGQAINGFVAGLDWKVLGNTLAQGLNTAIIFLNTLVTTINFNSIGSSIATGLNTAVQNLNWAGLGQLLVAKWNIIFQTLAGFVTTFKWTDLGLKLATGFTSAWNSIDWVSMSTTVSEGIKGVLDTCMAFLENVDWEQVGKDIWNFLKSIDWKGIIQKLAMTLGELIAGIGLLLWGFIEDAVNSIKDYFSEKIEESGGDIVDGLYNGISEALENLGLWIYNNIFKPFIDGFKKVFGIHSPSTVMAEMGTFIIDGLKNGLLGIWDKVKTTFTNLKNNIVNTFTNIKTSVKNTMDSLKSSLKEIWDGIWNTIKGIINKIIGGVEKLCNTVIKGLNKIIEPLTKVGNSILKAVGIKNFSFSAIGEISLPRLKIGTDMVKEEGLAYLHAGEKVVPADVVKGGYSGESSNNEETNNLLRQLIELIDDKDLNVNIDGRDIGEASVNYIRKQSRIRGGSII